MSEINISLEGGTSKRLLTAGKYCDRDIVVTAEGGSGLGALSQYVKISATPETSVSFTIKNPLGGLAKKVFVKRTTTDATSSRKVQKYIADAELGIGVMELIDTSGNVKYTARMATGTPNNGDFSITDGKIILYRYNSANAWDSANAYDVEIYQ